MVQGFRAEKQVLPGSVASSKPDELAGPTKQSPSVLQLSLRPPPQVLSSIPRRTFKGLRSFRWIHSSRHRLRPTNRHRWQFIRSQPSKVLESAVRERLLKARLPDLYYGKSHMECYHFWQQWEDHFNIASATCLNRRPFASSFLWGRISFCWHQYKRRNQGEGGTLLSWPAFQLFYERILATLGPLWIQSGAESNGTLNTNKR